MKKAYVTLFILTAAIFGLRAQITITAVDAPVVGDVLVFRDVANAGQLSPGSAGAGVVWDFTSLVTTADTFATGVFAPEGRPFADQFPDATLAIGSEVEGVSAFAFAQVTADGLYLLGVGAADTSDLNLFFAYTPPQQQLAFPSTYETSFTSVSTSIIEFVDEASGASFTLKSEEELEATIDGYGTLKLPGGDYDALRLRRITTTTDSTFLVILGNTVPVEATTRVDTSYEFLTKEAPSPILTLDIDSSEVLLATVLDLELSSFGGSTNVQELQADLGLTILPNPADSEFRILAQEPLDDALQLHVIGVDGKLIWSGNLNGSLTVPTTDWPSGIYYLLFRNRHNQRWATPLSVQH